MIMVSVTMRTEQVLQCRSGCKYRCLVSGRLARTDNLQCTESLGASSATTLHDSFTAAVLQARMEASLMAA
jgi:hypothetical protein